MGKVEQSWLVAPLPQNQPLREVVIRREGLLKATKELCRLDRELIGFIYGYPSLGSLLLVGMNTYGVGNESSSELDTFYLERHNEFLEKARTTYPTLTSMIYHSHPRVRPIQFPEQIVQQLEEDLRNGIFDYLRDYGVKPTLDLALAEFSRALSQDDLDNIVGRLTILLTDTRWPKDEFSHLNVYEIGRDIVTRVRVVALEDKPQEFSLVFDEVADNLHTLQLELKQKYGHSK